VATMNAHYHAILDGIDLEDDDDPPDFDTEL
jgi:hypothetical protein